MIWRWQESIQPVVHCLPHHSVPAKRTGMKAVLTALIFGVSTPTALMAANPLSEAEQPVCRSLSHCLTIVDNHAHDSFDYAVLADEFQGFGKKGRKALIKRIEKGGSSSGHAADLIALMGDKDALARLRKRRTDDSALIARTVTALNARLTPEPSTPPAPLPSLPLSDSENRPPVCARGTPLKFEARRREMPFFERSMATPDRYGAYRPSAAFNAPLALASRSHLRTARPVPGGWLAGYPDGLLSYDNDTGAPRLRIKGDVLSVQARHHRTLTPDSWAFILNANNQTYIVDVGPNSLRLVTTLTGPLTELRRGKEGVIYAASEAGSTITLRPDGSVKAGCGDTEP